MISEAGFKGSTDQPGFVCRVPEVVGSIPLAEATSGHEADARLLQHLHAVKHVGLLTFVLPERNRKHNQPLTEVSYSGATNISDLKKEKNDAASTAVQQFLT